jgi:dihydroorotate dehydrogenase
VDDYLKCFNELYEVVDYFVVNVSSPNTPNLRALQEKEPLKKILFQLQEVNHQKIKPKACLIKNCT